MTTIERGEVVLFHMWNAEVQGRSFPKSFLHQMEELGFECRSELFPGEFLLPPVFYGQRNWAQEGGKLIQSEREEWASGLVLVVTSSAASQPFVRASFSPHSQNGLSFLLLLMSSNEIIHFHSNITEMHSIKVKGPHNPPSKESHHQQLKTILHIFVFWTHTDPHAHKLYYMCKFITCYLHFAVSFGHLFMSLNGTTSF